jgi:NAD+ synthase (glutamine-hydrolysing)
VFSGLEWGGRHQIADSSVRETSEMLQFGFVRMMAAAPRIRVADCAYNAERIVDILARAERDSVALVVFPELAVTGYTCADLFQQSTLQRGALAALDLILRKSRALYSGAAVVGVPLAVDDQLFNCAVVFQEGRALGAVPKSFIPNYKEFYEGRWFASAATARSRSIRLCGEDVPFGTDLLFQAFEAPELIVGVEICEDLWVPVSPSALQALGGASVLVNLSASNEVIGKSAYRRQLVVGQSGRCIAGYVYSSSGVCESTTDVVFGGHCLIAENGTLLGESLRFQREDVLLTADVDLDRLRVERIRTNSFGNAQLFPGAGQEFRRIAFSLSAPKAGVRPHLVGGAAKLLRTVDAHPFVPAGKDQLRERCEEIFSTQVSGLVKRLEHIGNPPVAIGVSGGLDSTLALLVATKTMDALKAPRQSIRAFTMPGFGTTPRTHANARRLMQQLETTSREIDIRALCLEEMKAIGHKPFGIGLEGVGVEELASRLADLDGQGQDLVFENVQARMRTNILMNSGFVVGTSDLSELALGWATYNGDHMSMYNPNVSIPKTLVKFLVHWAATNEFDGEVRRTLLDIVATDISPELLPPGKNGQQSQATEGVIGPYELHDFFLYHFLRYGASPQKILFLAEHATFDKRYAPEEIQRWLRVFLERFFASQFKRSCLPDGPKVGTVSLSPRGDWRMPSDAEASLWLAELAAESASVQGNASAKAQLSAKSS